MVFEGATSKEAVIRCITYDLLFNNMKSIVVKTSNKCRCPPVVPHVATTPPTCHDIDRSVAPSLPTATTFDTLVTSSNRRTQKAL